jgi:hypothetical protein
MKNHLLTKLGHNLRPTYPPLTVSTSKCKVNQLQQPGTILPTQLLDKQKTKMAEATIGALANLATATASYHGVVGTLMEANARLVKQLEDNSN